MLGRSVGVFVLVVASAGTAHAQSAPSWYWCDAPRGYYPTVQSCPGGWRPVASQGTSPAPRGDEFHVVWIPSGRICSGGLKLSPGERVRQCNAAKQEAERQNAVRAAQQRQIDEARGKAVSEEIDRTRAENAEAVHKNASPNLLKFEKETITFMLDGRLASAANVCHLRSERWYTNIALGIDMFFDQEAQTLGLSDRERSAAQFKADQEIKKQAPVSCSKLLNSPTMDRLDALERQITGNYH